MWKRIFSFYIPTLMLAAIFPFVHAGFSMGPESSATQSAAVVPSLYVLQDPINWRVTHPQITWRLDQKIIDELKLTKVEVDQREQSLRNSLVNGPSVEMASITVFPSAGTQPTFSVNPLSTLAGQGANSVAVADVAVSEKLGASWSRTRAKARGESPVDVAFARAISQPEIQFTVVIRNDQPKNLICRNLNIPIVGADKIMAQAIPVDSNGQPLAEVTVPANHPDGIDQIFTAKIDDSSFRQFVQAGGLADGLELNLDRATGQILSGIDGADLISARASELHGCIRVAVEFPTGASITWLVARRSTANATGPQAAIDVAQVLETINAALRDRLATKTDMFCLQDGVLVSALGDDQYLSGYVWAISSGGRSLKLDDDLRTTTADKDITLCKRPSTAADTINFPAQRAQDWSLLVACGEKLRAKAKELPVPVEKIEALAATANPWSPHACDLLGRIYHLGIVTAKDDAKAVGWFKKAADANLGEGSRHLGLMYENGSGVDKDYTAAMKWFSQAANAGDSQADRDIAALYMKGLGVDRDYAAAMKWLQNGASAGDARAMLTIGRIYEVGLGVEKDYSAAMKWYRKAVDAGNVEAIAALGRMYENGFGVTKDYARAMEWYRKAADAGEADALNEIGLLYQNGFGVDKDNAAAMQWYRKAADAGDSLAMLNLGVMYRKGLGVDKDYTEAMKWYRKAADAGNPRAANEIGVLYRDGLGVDKNYTEAMKWFQKAADAGNLGAIVGLGKMYENGFGVNKDYAQAMEWYRKAADAGEADALNDVGVMYQNGLGVVKDYTEAMKWYRKAADAGDSLAMVNIGLLCAKGMGTEQNNVEAMKWYRKAADAGNARAMTNIAVLYENGLGVDNDYAAAMKWYRKAADAGDAYAMVCIARMYHSGSGVVKDDTEAAKWMRNAANLGNKDAKQWLQDQKLSQ